MSRKNEMARNLFGQEPSRVDSHVNAANTRIIAQRKPSRHNGGKAYTVKTTGGDIFRVVVSGRVRWALDQLCRVGLAGCTPIDNPAPRWSAYIFDLRGMGIEIETIHEPHEGEFAGTHGRYVLRSTLTRVMQGDAI
ncbi:winged helix domain-containing protein [Yoonia sp. MH D7]